jgi:tetratricopeptide (TPR) repeat protein
MLPLVAVALLIHASPLDANLAFQEGMRLSEQFEYEKAIFRFREAARDESLGVDRATVLVWLGLTYAKVGEQQAADDAFVDAVRIDPLVALPPSTPPKILEALEGARRRVRDERAKAATAAPPPPTTPTPTTTTTPTTATTTTTAPAATAHESMPATTTSTTATTATTATTTAFPSVAVGGAGLLGLGAVVVGGGAVLGALALGASDDANAAEFQDDRQRLNESASAQALAANVCFGIGGAAAVGGVITLGLALAGGAP